jgi:hypothetical protein
LFLLELELVVVVELNGIGCPAEEGGSEDDVQDREDFGDGAHASPSAGGLVAPTWIESFELS